jgi:UDP-N-acetylmuramyl tripeptide synthase
MGEDATVTAPLRTRAAIRLGQAVSELSRRAGRGQGSSVGGKVMLALDPQALALVARGHRVAMVSGTNGKTTTTRLLAAALGAEGPVTSNSAGANLLSGLVSTLAGAPAGALGALEVDEGLLPAAVSAIRPVAVVLLNLSRDQLDRIGEVRLHAESWRRALAAAPGTIAVANADDPLVAFAARENDHVTWVGTGQRWRSDAAACPVCGGRIRWATDGAWSCDSCEFSKPTTEIELDGDEIVLPGGKRLTLQLQLPGWCNRANAAMALGGALGLGTDPSVAVEAMADVGTVAGRYQVVDADGVQVRLLLAKNPAGWAETLDLIRPAPLPVIIGINARVADGRDPSWLWDVPFERLAGRLVIATGDRGRDLAVRLRYADVEHRFVRDYRDAVRKAGAAAVDLAANYTSFQDARGALRTGGANRD